MIKDKLPFADQPIIADATYNTFLKGRYLYSSVIYMNKSDKHVFFFFFFFKRLSEATAFNFSGNILQLCSRILLSSLNFFFFFFWRWLWITMYTCQRMSIYWMAQGISYMAAFTILALLTWIASYISWRSIIWGSRK